MTQLKPFRETMTEIGNIFGFHNIQLDELESIKTAVIFVDKNNNLC